MAINFIGSAAALGDSLTLPSHQKGDCLIVQTFRTSNVAASLPVGWVSIAANQASGLSARAGFRIAESSSETSGTWTNATGLACLVFRPTSGTIAFPSAATASGTSATVTYPTLTGVVAADNFIDQTFCMFGATLLETNAIETPPTGTTFLDKQSQTGLAFASFRLTTNAFGNWNSQSVTLTSAQYRTVVLRIAEYPFPPFGGGGTFSPLNHPLIN